MNIQTIIQTYKRAWEEHDLDLLKKIFAKNATYLEKPDSEPLTGFEEIAKYWIYNSKTQKDVNFIPKSISYDGKRYAVEWEASFYRLDLGHGLHLAGTIWLEIKNNKITKFSEEFIKKTIAS